MSCPSADLDAFVRFELSPEASTSVAAHVESCAACRREVSWLRAEIALARRHANANAASTDRLWSEVARRIAEPAPALKVRPPRWAAALAFIPAAAVLVLALRSQGPRVTGPASPERASATLQRSLDAVASAERDYRAAVDQLEAEYRAERSHLAPEEAMRWDATLELARTRLGEARLAASADVDGQMKVLRGYSAYVHTLHRAVNELQETSK